jgi:methylmalonyl-CoA mutase
MLAYESHLDHVSDPAAGAYFIETKTQELVDQAWAYLQEIRFSGGIVEALRKGLIQDKIAAEVAQAQPEQVLGANLYPSVHDQWPEDFVVQEPKTRAAHQKAHAEKEIEPLMPIRWAAKAEFARASQTVKNA